MAPRARLPSAPEPQLELFAPAPHARRDPREEREARDDERASPGERAELIALAQRIPAHVRLGTSSWSFAGWRGIVWPSHLRWTDPACGREGLPIYARHPLLRTVGIDRSFYAPVPLDDLARYATQLPEGFIATAKVWEAHTLDRYPRAAIGAHAPDNPRYLDAQSFDETTLQPYAQAFSAHAGPFVLEFAAGAVRDENCLFPRLARFLRESAPGVARVGAHASVAVEVRDRKLLDARLAAAILGAQGGRASYCFTYHPAMPSLSLQARWALARGLFEPGGPPLVIRLMLPPHERYTDRKAALAPFDRIAAPQTQMRDETMELIALATRAGRGVFVIVNNKAEGCAPLTVIALAERIAAGA